MNELIRSQQTGSRVLAPLLITVTGLILSFCHVLYLIESGPANTPEVSFEFSAGQRFVVAGLCGFLAAALFTRFIQRRGVISLWALCGGALVSAISWRLGCTDAPFALAGGMLAGVFSSPGILRIRQPAFGDGALYAFTSFNILLIYASFSPLVPSPLQTPDKILLSFFEVGYADALRVEINPTFMLLRGLINSVLGITIYSSCLSSMILLSISMALFSMSTQMISGRIAGWGLLALMLTDRWIIAAGLCGNLVVTPILPCAALLYLLVRFYLCRQSGIEEPSCWLTALCMVPLFAHSMYSYAPVRLPLALGIGMVCLVYFLRSQKGLAERIRVLSLSLMFPGVIVAAAVVIVPYDGSFERLSQELLSKPENLLEARPESIPDSYEKILNPDSPIWYSFAFSAKENHSLVWKSSFSEMRQDLGTHFSRIFIHSPWKPILLLLMCAALLYAVGCAPAHQRLLIGLLFVWCVIWLSPYLLTPDAVAYRRAISSSAVALVLVSVLFSFLLPRQRLLQAGAFAALSFAQYPSSFMSDQAVARGDLSAYCQGMFPARAVLLDEGLSNQELVFAGTELQHPTYTKCMEHALLSEEFRRQFLGASKQVTKQGEFLNVLNQPIPAVLVLDCVNDSKRDAEVRAVCEGRSSIGKFTSLDEGSRAPAESNWAALVEISRPERFVERGSLSRNSVPTDQP